MAEVRLGCVDRRRQRRWSFAGCIFDEANWTLIVDGRRVPVEIKPLEMLRELLLRAGNVVTKDQLMDAIWPDVEVVEASLPTAIGKLRRALGDDGLDEPIIVTVPRIGYRLAVPVEVEEPADAPDESAVALQRATAEQPDAKRAVEPGGGRGRPSPRKGILVLAGGLAIAAAAIAMAGPLRQIATTPAAAPAFTQRDVFISLRNVDVEAVDKLLAAGWDPNTPLDTDHNGAINILLGNCEWDPGHDQRRMVLMARALIEGGTRVTDRNAWGDTPYSIATADRYCGPNHPVTKMIHRLCYEGEHPIGDRCRAQYQRDPSGAVLRRS